MNSRIFTILAGVVISVVTITGCSTNTANSPNTTSSQEEKQIQTSKTHADGTISSIQQIKTYQSLTGTDVKLYKMFYWSNGYKVEAFLTEPSKNAKYPLLVNLHGGVVWRNARASVEGIGYTAKDVAYFANNHTVMLYPEYQGYMDSQGSVMGIKTDLLDVKNAIKAANSMSEVKANDTYLEGYSLGGGLALITASQNHDVRAVVAVSPFVGLADFVKWAQSNSKPNSVSNYQMTLIEASYGENINSSAYEERSPDVQSIKAPVLLLQGTADKHVAWQTVQIFANQMKKAKKTVKLVLYPGGQHGLHTIPYQSESNQQMTSWFQKYGLNTES